MSEEATQWPPHKYALSELKKRDLVKYGESILWPVLLEIFNVGDKDGWEFRGEFLNLSAALKEEGFLFTERGMNGEGVRIMTREEMAEAVKNKELAKANDSLRNSLMLSNVPRQNLSESEVKKLDHWENKTALIGATTKVLLRKRNLPSPEMAIKSIKEIA